MKQPWIADPKEFAVKLKRTKEVMIPLLQTGLWKNLSIAQISPRFTISRAPRFLLSPDGKKGEKAYVTEVTAYTDGDANHVHECLRNQGSFIVPCIDSESDEDPAGDPKYPPALITYHNSVQATVRATLQSRRATGQGNRQNTVDRAEELTKDGKVYRGGTTSILQLKC